MDLDETLILSSDEYSDTEFSQIIVHLNIPTQDSIKEAKQFLLKEGPNVIGRCNACDIPIPNYALSRKHAVIEIEKDSCLIYDAGSQNKTWKGKLLLKPNVKYSLEHNDSIKFANVKSYIIIEQSKEKNEDAGSETGSESLIPNKNDDTCSNLVVNIDKEHKITKRDEVSPDEKAEVTPTVSYNTALEANINPSTKEKLKNNPEQSHKATDSCDDTTDDERLMNLATVPYNKFDDSGTETTDDERLMNAVTQPNNTQSIPNKKCNNSNSETTDDEVLMNAITQPYSSIILNEKSNDFGSKTTNDEKLMKTLTVRNNSDALNDESGDKLMNEATLPYDQLKESWDETKDKKTIIHECNDTDSSTSTDNKPKTFPTVSHNEHGDKSNNTNKNSKLLGKPTNLYSKSINSDDEMTDDESLINAPTQCYLEPIERLPTEVQSDKTVSLSSKTEIHKPAPSNMDLMAETICFSESDNDEDLLNAETQPYTDILTNSVKDKSQKRIAGHKNIPPSKISHDSYLNSNKGNKKLITAQTESAICLKNDDGDQILMNAPTQPYLESVDGSAHEINNTNTLNSISDQDSNEETTNILIAETVPYSEVDINVGNTNINTFVAETQEYDSSSIDLKAENTVKEYHSLNIKTDEALKEQISNEKYRQNIIDNKNSVVDDDNCLKLRTAQELSSNLHFPPTVKAQNSKAESHHISLASDPDSSFSAYRSKFMLEESLADLSANDILCASTQPQDIDEIKQTIIRNVEVDTACDFLAETQEDIINSYDRKQIEKAAYNQCINTPPTSPNCEWVAETPPDLLDSSNENNVESSLGKHHSSLKQMEQYENEETQMLISVEPLPKSNIVSGAELTVSCTNNDTNFKMEKKNDCDLNTIEPEGNLLISEDNEKKINAEEKLGIFKSKQKEKFSKKADDIYSNSSANNNNNNNNNEKCINSDKIDIDIARLDLTKEDEMQVLVHSAKEKTNSDKNIEKYIRKSKRNCQNSDNNCIEKNKTVKRSLAFENDNHINISEQGNSESNNNCNFVTDRSKKNPSKESRKKIVPVDDETNPKNTVKTKRSVRNKDNCRNENGDDVSKRTRKSNTVKNTRTNTSKIASEKITVTSEADIGVAKNPPIDKETIPQNSKSKSQIISIEQESATKSSIKLKRATQKKSNNASEENESTTVPQKDNNTDKMFINIKHYNCEEVTASPKSPQNKISERSKGMKPTDCHVNLGNSMNSSKTAKDSEVIQSKSTSEIKKLLSDNGQEKSENIINANNDSSVDTFIVESLESNSSLDDNSCHNIQQLRKSSRQRKRKSHPEFETYPPKRLNNLQSAPITTSSRDIVMDSTDLDRKTSNKEKNSNEQLQLEKNNKNSTRSRKNKKKESEAENEIIGNTSGELIDNIALKLLEKRNESSVNKAINHNKDSLSIELSSEASYTSSRNVQDKQEKKLGVAKATQRSKRGKTKIEDHAKSSELPDGSLEVTKQSEQKTLHENVPESAMNLRRPKGIVTTELHHTENSKTSPSSIEEGMQLKRSCRSTTRSREKKLAESCKKLLLDSEQKQNESEQDSDIYKEAKVQSETRFSKILQSKKSSTKSKLDVENIDADTYKGLKSDSGSTDAEETDKRIKSLSKKTSSTTSKSKKSPIKKDFVAENSNLDDSKQFQLEVKPMEAEDDGNINISKKLQNDNDSPTILENNKLPSKSTMGEEDLRLDVSKQLNSRNKRKCPAVRDNSTSSIESFSLKVTTPSKIRRKTTETLPKTNQTASPSKRKRLKLKIMFTGVADNEGQKIATKLGGEIVDDPKVCTHLVTDKFRRTVKMLCCIAKGIPVVETKWLEESKSAASFIDPFKYLLKDKAAEKQYKFNLQNTLKQAEDAPLFQGWSMYATSNVKPSPDQMKDIVFSAGGKYLSRIPARFSEKTVIISCPEDLKLCKQAAKSGIPIVGAEFLLTGLIRYENDITSNQLSIA